MGPGNTDYLDEDDSFVGIGKSWPPDFEKTHDVSMWPYGRTDDGSDEQDGLMMGPGNTALLSVAKTWPPDFEKTHDVNAWPLNARNDDGTDEQDGLMMGPGNTALVSIGEKLAMIARDPHYKDTRNEELKCRANRNREWSYDGKNNSWLCKQRDWETPNYEEMDQS